MPARCQLLSGSLGTLRAYPHRLQSPRNFTTSASLCRNPLARRRGGDLGSHLPKHVIPRNAAIPEYPYGPSLLFKQMNKGLYGGQTIQFGNNVSPDTETKTRRYWKPNVLSKSLYSVALKKRIQIDMTSSVLKTIDREGGLDEYLLKPSESRIRELGPMGWALRWTLMQKPEVIERMRTEAAALGVAQEQIDAQWPAPVVAAEQVAHEAAEALVARLENNTGRHEGPQDARAQKRQEEKRVKAIRQIRHRIRNPAVSEYNKALNAAQRYVSRGLVDTEEDGLKLAFVREKERATEREQNRAAFREKLAAQYGPIETRKDFNTYAWKYRQSIKESISAVGGYQNYRDSLMTPEIADRRAAAIAGAGGEAAYLAQRKAEAAKRIEQAENAHLGETLSEDERQYMQSAIQKAKRAIKAKGDKESYARATFADHRRRNAQQWPFISPEKPARKSVKTQVGEEAVEKDAWAALVDSTRPGPESRPNV